ncbi:phosphotransacetylase family protein [Pleurocapsales cyanobacterium LEGE 10410]|nr:phosphotransacetylase family protein [Pleurocapsales cyanobacterium LEGE 10410]
MVTSAKHLLVASTEAYCGKSATILGLNHLCRERGISVGYGQPLATDLREDFKDVQQSDNNFFTTTLGLSPEQAKSPFLTLDRHTINQRLQGEDRKNYIQALQEYVSQIEGDLILLKGPGNLWEGSIFNMSVPEIAESVDASILLVARYHPLLLVGSLRTAKKFLGDRLLGVVLNDIPPTELNTAAETIKPYLEDRDIPVLGMIPKDRILNSVSVKEIATRLNAQVLCCSEHLNWMVESLSIGAMNVNSALEYFRQRENMAVVTGGDRAELQMAALETSTHCLILTGRIPPKELIIERAESLDIPILSVDTDTLTTVEVIDGAFGKVPIREAIKVRQIEHLMKQHFNIDRLIQYLGLEVVKSI